VLIERGRAVAPAVGALARKGSGSSIALSSGGGSGGGGSGGGGGGFEGIDGAEAATRRFLAAIDAAEAVALEAALPPPLPLPAPPSSAAALAALAASALALAAAAALAALPPPLPTITLRSKAWMLPFALGTVPTW
jgi:hypothetical protein